MRALLFKLGHIVVPFLLVALAFVALYSAANYFLVITTGWIPIDRNLANGWLPLALGLIVTSVFISPRLRVLKPDKDGDTPFFYFMVAAATLIAPTSFAQYYLSAEAGKLVHVERAEMIATAPPAAYYTATSVCVDRQNAMATGHSELSGRNNEYLDFKLYVLAPVCGTGQSHAWIALNYSDSIDSGASEEDKTAKRDAFLTRTQTDFDAYDFGKAQYFESLPRTTDRRIYEKLLAQHGVAKPDAAVILIPHLDSFESRGGRKLLWALDAFGGGALVFLMMVLFRGLDAERVDERRLPKSARKRGKDSFKQMFIPRPGNYGLPILLDVNLGVYIAMVFAGLGVVAFQTDDLLDWGANYGPADHGLGVYRWVTSQFVHGGAMHLLSNMYGLIFAGLLLTPVLRKWGLVLSYLFCGLAASVVSELSNPKTVAIGASGAIMGLFGILLTLALLGDRRVVGARGAILLNCAIFAGLTLFVGANTPGIDNAAHVAGVVAGAVLGLPIFAFGWGAPIEIPVHHKAAEDSDPAAPDRQET